MIAPMEHSHQAPSLRRPLPPSAKTVADLMTSPPVSACADETLGQAADRMSESGVGSVLVLDGDRLVGILTERDLVRAAAAGARPSGAVVGDWMTPEPDSVGPDVEVVDAWRSLASHGYRHIPVVDGDAVRGIVSIRDLVRVAQLRPVDGVFTDVPRGLEGVVAAETSLGSVRGLEGFYHYRQYSAIDLATRRSFEDVWRLLFDGELPVAEESARFAAEVRPLRRLPEPVSELLPQLVAASSGAPLLDQLRTAVSLLGTAEGFRPTHDLAPSEARADAMRVCAAVPTLVAALWRTGRGKRILEPNDELGYAANYLYMLFGEEPDPRHARAIERYLVSTIDHGLNASTFTARVVTSTGADVAAAVVAGIGALSGPLHGGAPSRALDTLDGIGTPDRTDAFIREAVERGDRIMGFGHRVYKTLDPRSELMRETAEELGGPLVDFAEQVEQTVVRVLDEMKPGRRLYTNVEFYAGVVMELCGLPRELFTPTFAVSRAVGWCAHLLEQATDNRIIRPSSRYVGPPPPQPVPAADATL
ncbi:MAG TPA: citrate synthase [Acidimicrobiales bacterium]|nr:citrate synthase [Acidimicrobiales bacterium]